MPYQALESFTWAGDQSPPAALFSRYNGTMFGPVVPTVFASGGRFGGGRLHTEVTFTGVNLRTRANVTSRQVVMGFAARCSVFQNPTVFNFFEIVRNGADQFSFRTDTLGRIQVFSGDGSAGSPLAVGVTQLNNNSWYFFEFIATLDAVAGSVTCQIDGTPQFTVSGVNTAAANADGMWNSFNLLANNAPSTGSGGTDFCDLYVLDSGAMVGPSRVIASLPGSNGVTNQWAPNTPPNFSQVNSHPPPGDAAFVSDGTPGDIDLYSMAAYTVNPQTVFALQLGITARITDAGVHSINPMFRSSALNFFGAAQQVTASYLSFYNQIFLTDPNTGLPLTIVGINASQFGQRLAS